MGEALHKTDKFITRLSYHPTGVKTRLREAVPVLSLFRETVKRVYKMAQGVMPSRLDRSL